MSHKKQKKRKGGKKVKSVTNERRIKREAIKGRVLQTILEGDESASISIELH